MSWLEREVATIALCWRIERTDGVAVGLTAHDCDLQIDGLLHRAAPGMTPSAVQRRTGLEADTMEVAGALTAAALSGRDLPAGRWDGARVRCFAVDWTDPSASSGQARSRIELGEGTIGTVELGEAGFTAELLGPGAALDAPVHEETSPECRATLGDKRCRAPMAGRIRQGRVVAWRGAVVTIDRREPTPGCYGGGKLRWFDGANSGIESRVALSAGATLTLVEPPPHPVEPGVLVEITEGCDKSFATCVGRFGNAANFRGEPHLPGMDLVTRWPGA